MVSPLVALNTSAPREFVTIPPESIIEIADSIHRPGMVRIKLGDQIFFAVGQDIEKHTEPVEGSAHG
jgi:hypothetical protein